MNALQQSIPPTAPIEAKEPMVRFPLLDRVRLAGPTPVEVSLIWKAINFDMFAGGRNSAGTMPVKMML